MADQSIGDVIDADCCGVGIGLRPQHLRKVLIQLPNVPWFEVHICNYLNSSINLALLEKIREYYSLSFHGVNLNLGGVEPLDRSYLTKLKQLVDKLEPGLVSEHACFTAHDNHYFHDLLPIPFTATAVQHMAERIDQVQDFLGRKILLENVSRYYRFEESELSEAEFYSQVCQKSGCGLLLDLCNAHINEHNLNESVEGFITGLPLEKVEEVHLAGFSKANDQSPTWIDTHNHRVNDSVWELYRQYVHQLSHVPCLIEWDSQLPELDVLLDEKQKAETIYKHCLLHKDNPTERVCV